MDFHQSIDNISLLLISWKERINGEKSKRMSDVGLHFDYELYVNFYVNFCCDLNNMIYIVMMQNFFTTTLSVINSQTTNKSSDSPDIAALDGVQTPSVISTHEEQALKTVMSNWC